MDLEIRAGNFTKDMFFFFGGRVVAGDPAHGGINNADDGPTGKVVRRLDLKKFVRFDFVIAHSSILTRSCPKTNNAGLSPRCRKVAVAGLKKNYFFFFVVFLAAGFLAAFFFTVFLTAFLAVFLTAFFLAAI
jgi:hypothetical protein